MKQFCIRGHERTPENLDKRGNCKTCHKEIAKQWQLNNTEKRKESCKTYRETNSEKVKESQVKFYKDNPEKSKEFAKKWRLDNLEIAKERVKACQKAKPEVRSRAAHKRRAVVHNAFVAHVTPSKIYRRDWYMCKLCNQPLNMNAKAPHPLSPSIDHVIPLTKGGTHEPSNVQAAHLRCNISKGNRI